MSVQNIINRFFRQNFRDPFVLGRVLFGLSVLFIGFAYVLDVDRFASVIPELIPFAGIGVFLVGLLHIFGGFLIAVDIKTVLAARVLVLLFALAALVLYLPQGAFLAMVEELIFIAAALLVTSIRSVCIPEKEQE
jgi:uncharacterized membrane protein